jgi:hypothetical protein
MTTLSRPISTSDTALDELAALVLSRVVWGHRDRGGQHLSHLLRFLRVYANTPVRVDDADEPLPAPAPALSADGKCRAQATVWRKLGTSFDEERRFWDELVTEQGHRRAVAPRERIEAYVPAEYWAAVHAIINDGPRVFVERAHATLLALRDTPIRATKRRPEGGFPMQGTLDIYATMAGRMVKPLISADELWLPEGNPVALHLARWRSELNQAPKLRVKAHEAEVSTVADGPVPSNQARLLFGSLNDQVRRRLQMTEDEVDELAALDERVVNLKRLRRTAAFQVLRARAMLVLLCTLGSRVTSITEIQQQHVVDKRPGSKGPAVRITPHKTDDGGVPRWKPIAPDAWVVLEVYRRYVQHARRLNGLPPLEPTDPFFLSRLLVGRAKWERYGVTAWLGGVPDAMLAALPLDPSQPYRGYTPHSVRKLCRQWMTTPQAIEWAAEHNLSPERLEVIGETALDHDLGDLPSLYKGDATVEGKERNAGLAAELVWELLTTDRGLRKVADAETYRQALLQRKTAREERDTLRTELQRMCNEAERSGQELSPTAMNARLLRLDQLSTEELDAEKTILAVEAGRIRVPVPDELAEPPRVDLAQVRAAALGDADPTVVPLRRRRRLRNWLTPDELAQVLGVGASTIRSWQTNGLPASKPIWREGALHEFSSRRRAIVVDLLSEEALNHPDKRTAMAEVLATDAPAGWTTFPLMIGERQRRSAAA